MGSKILFHSVDNSAFKRNIVAPTQFYKFNLNTLYHVNQFTVDTHFSHSEKNTKFEFCKHLKKNCKKTTLHKDKLCF